MEQKCQDYIHTYDKKSKEGNVVQGHFNKTPHFSINIHCLGE